jgi:flagellar biosynthesis protein FliQ
VFKDGEDTVAMSPDLIQAAVDMTRRAIVLTLELSLPVLAVGMVVGLLVSLLQAVTQIQEQTLSFIPKALAVAATVFFTLPWVLTVLVDYTREIFLGMRTVLVP